MKAYMFDVEMAMLYGVDNAVMIWNLSHWIEHNAANEKNFHDGRYWTYNSIEAYTKLFPFWSKGQIRRILKSLEDSGVIMTGNYNVDRRDRSTWYAFTDSFLQMHLSKSTNANVETDKSLNNIDINRDNINTDINTDNAADGGLFAPETKIETATVTRPRRTSEKLCLFADSRYYDYKTFQAEFDLPGFADIDISYYYNAVADWSAQKGKKMRDWIATARNFIRSDIEKGKLHRLTGNGGLTDDALKYLKQMAE